MQREPFEEESFVGVELERVSCLATGVEGADRRPRVGADRGAVEVA
jgi:hypothetical protein